MQAEHDTGESNSRSYIYGFQPTQSWIYMPIILDALLHVTHLTPLNQRPFPALSPFIYLDRDAFEIDSHPLALDEPHPCHSYRYCTTSLTCTLRYMHYSKTIASPLISLDPISTAIITFHPACKRVSFMLIQLDDYMLTISPMPTRRCS